jgi:hypothetical protein
LIPIFFLFSQDQATLNVPEPFQKYSASYPSQSAPGPSDIASVSHQPPQVIDIESSNFENTNLPLLSLSELSHNNRQTPQLIQDNRSDQSALLPSFFCSKEDSQQLVGSSFV